MRLNVHQKVNMRASPFNRISFFKKRMLIVQLFENANVFFIMSIEITWIVLTMNNRHFILNSKKKIWVFNLFDWSVGLDMCAYFGTLMNEEMFGM